MRSHNVALNFPPVKCFYIRRRTTRSNRFVIWRASKARRRAARRKRANAWTRMAGICLLLARGERAERAILWWLARLQQFRWRASARRTYVRYVHQQMRAVRLASAECRHLPPPTRRCSVLGYKREFLAPYRFVAVRRDVASRRRECVLCVVGAPPCVHTQIRESLARGCVVPRAHVCTEVAPVRMVAAMCTVLHTDSSRARGAPIHSAALTPARSSRRVEGRARGMQQVSTLLTPRSAGDRCSHAAYSRLPFPSVRIHSRGYTAHPYANFSIVAQSAPSVCAACLFAARAARFVPVSFDGV